MLEREREQTLTARYESIKKLLEMLQSKGEVECVCEREREQTLTARYKSFQTLL